MEGEQREKRGELEKESLRYHQATQWASERGY
jgi:hypothetical protein